MNINEIINKLELSPFDKVNLILKDEYEGTQTVSGFSHEGSWRGHYNQPCIFMGDNQDKSELIEALHRLKSETYFGWKGGEYNYNGYDELNMEKNPRDWSGDGYIYRVVGNRVADCVELICRKSID